MLLCPGDAVLMHAKMAHREAPNYGDKIRLMVRLRLTRIILLYFQVYFRISHKQHAQQIKSCEQDLWAEFDIPPPDYFA